MPTTDHTTTIRLSAIDSGILVFAMMMVAAGLYSIADAIKTTPCVCVEATHADD